MPRYQLNGKTYNIPDNIVKQFESDNPNATTLYDVDGSKYAIPVSERGGFLETYPNAVLVDGTQQPVSAQTQQQSAPAGSKGWLGNMMDTVSKSIGALSQQQPAAVPASQPTPKAPAGKYESDAPDATVMYGSSPETVNSTIDEMSERWNKLLDEEEFVKKLAGTTADKRSSLITQRYLPELSKTFDESIEKEYGKETIALNKKVIDDMRNEYVKSQLAEINEHYKPITEEYAGGLKQEQEQKKEYLRTHPQYDPANYADIEEKYNRPLEYGERPEYREELKRQDKRDRFKDLERQAIVGQQVNSEIEIRRLENRLDEIRKGKSPVRPDGSFNPSYVWASDDELDLDAALRQRKKELTTISAELDDAGFWQGVVDAASDPSFYSFGVTDLQTVFALQRAKKAIESGKQLTDAQVMLLEATKANQDAQQAYAGNRGFWYNAADVAVNALPFVGEFVATGGGLNIMTAAGKKAGTAWAKHFTNKLAQRAVQYTGTALGDIAAGFTMANTTGAARTWADIEQRHLGQVEKTEDGYEFVGGEDWGDAVRHGLVANTLEYYTEKLGAHLKFGKVAGKVADKGAAFVGKHEMLGKGINKLGLSKMSDVLSRIKGSDFYAKGNALLEKGGVHELPGEILEEEANILLNSALVGDNQFSELWNLEKQLDLAGGLAVSVGFMRALPLAVSTAQYYRYEHKTDVADSVARFRLTEERWAPIKERIDNTENKDFSKVMANILSDPDLELQEKQAVSDYAKNLLKFRGFNLGTTAKAKDRLEKAGTGEEDPANVEDATNDAAEAGYQQGYQAQSAAQRKQYADEASAAAERVKALFDEEDQQAIFGDNWNSEENLHYYMSHRGEYTDEQIMALADYYQKQARLDGMIDAADNAVDLQVQNENAKVRSNTHQGTGQVITAKRSDEDFYVVGGDVVTDPDTGLSTLEGTGGAVVVKNALTGEVSVVSPQELTIISSQDAQALIDYNETTLRQQLTQQAEDDMINGDGGVSEEPGTTPNPAPTGEGSMQQGSILDNAGAEASAENGTGANDTSATAPEIPAGGTGNPSPSRAQTYLNNEPAQTNEEPSAMSQVVVDESGEPLWEQSPVDATLAALRELVGDEDATQMIDEEISDISNELASVRKKKVKRMNERLKRAENIKALEKRLAYWQSVKAEALKASEAVPEVVEQPASTVESETPVEPAAPATPIEPEVQTPVSEQPETPVVQQPQQPVTPQPQSQRPVTPQPQQPAAPQSSPLTAEEKVAIASVKKNLGKTFEYVGADGRHTKVRLDRIDRDGNVVMTVQRYDAQGRPEGKPVSRVSKVTDVGGSIIKKTLHQVKDADGKLRDIFKGKPLHYRKTLDVLTDEEKEQLLRAYESNDEAAFNDLYSEMQMNHFTDAVMKERDDRNIDVERILSGPGTKEEKLRKIRKLYQGNSDAEVALSDESMAPAPDSLEEYVADLLGNVPKRGTGTLAYYSYENGDNKITGLQDESGYGKRGFAGDTKAFEPWLAPKGKGMSLTRYAETIHSQLPESVQQYDVQDVRNALLNVFQSAGRPSDIPLTILRNRVKNAEDAMRREEDEVMEGGTYYQKVSLLDRNRGVASESREQAVRDALIEILREAGIEVIDDEEGQRVLDEANGKEKLMGTTTRNRQNEIANAFEGKELTKEQQAIVDVFSGNAKDASLLLTDKKGKKRNIAFRQGNENKAGVKHSVFHHYSTDANGYTADELLLIPEVIANGERKQDAGRRVTYKYEKDGVVYTVTTEVKGNGELFTNFFTNRKPNAAEQGTQNTANQRVQPQQSDSGAKVQEKSDTSKESGEKIKQQKASPDELKQREAQRDEEQSKQIFDTSKRIFGTTRDIREAGYILPDGTMLDFSGRHQMDPGSDTSFLRGRRSTDHREIQSIAYEKDGNTKTGIETDMPDFIRRGAIRIDDNAGTINLYMKPTKEQLAAIRKLVANNDGYVQVDFGDGWDSEHYVEYDKAKPSRVLADIDRYYDEGIRPEGDAGEMPRYQKVSKPTFYSNAMKALEGIKQEKATPEQWLAMITKAGGLKAGEDKWLGLSDWLKEQKGSITKQDVLDFIRKNQVEVEEQHYSEYNYAAAGKLDELNREYTELCNKLFYELDDNEEIAKKAYDEMVERYGEDFTMAFEITPEGHGTYKLSPVMDMYDEPSDAARFFLGEDDGIKTANRTRLRFTTGGLRDNKEIALTVPTIEPWNESDEIHFGDAGEGRAVAWVRFGDAYAPNMGGDPNSLSDGVSKVLVIDEIQSKRHQEGREKGYKDTSAYTAKLDDKTGHWFIYKNGEKVNEQYYREGQTAEQVAADYAEKYEEGVPEAPFDKNWHELAMKRMLRYAAENGYDKVAWTKGAQQAHRYGLGGIVNSIGVRNEGDMGKIVGFKTNNGLINFSVKEDGIIHESVSTGLDGKLLSDVVGKDLAAKIMAVEPGKPQKFESENELSIGGEGMKGFYDEMLPRFMNKYGKKWGVKVGEVQLPGLENSQEGVTMWSVDVTPEMRESVMQGQPMFFKTPSGEAYGYTLNGKIYIDPRIATSETPIHEYGHLWAAMKRQTAPEEWKNIKDVLLKDKLVQPFIDKVKKEYPELLGEGKEDDFIEEVLTQYSGRRGAERMREVAEEIAKENGGVFGKAQAVEALRRMRNLLARFWQSIADMMGWRYTNAEEIADKVLSDLLEGVNPNEVMAKAEEGKKSGEWALSEQKAKNGERFYQLPDGNINLVDIPQDVFDKINHTKAPFRLTESMVKHVFNQHAKELKLKTIDDAINFVMDVMTNFDHVRQGDDGSLIFSIEDGRNTTGKRAITILLGSDNGDYYGIKTSGYESLTKLKKRPLLWEGSAKTPSTDTATEPVTSRDAQQSGEQSGSASGQSGLSAGKGRENISINQEKAEENAEILREGEERTVSLTDKPKEMTPKQQRSRQAFAERQWRRAHEHADETVKKLNLGDNVTIVDSIDELEGHKQFSDRKKAAKGWYDPETGKIVIVMGNHNSPTDVVKTILHEGVAHHGLRKLFGDRFDTFLDNAYNSAHSSIQEEIDKLSEKYGNDTRKATEEYLARLAEDTDFENAENKPWLRHWFNQIKEWFLNMLKELGLPGYEENLIELTDNELRYLLWRSYKNLSEPGRYRNVFQAINQKQRELKEKYPDALFIFKMPDGSYRAVGDDVEAVGSAFGRGAWGNDVNSSEYNIPEDRIDWLLPRLVRQGYRVGIADAPREDVARENEDDVRFYDGVEKVENNDEEEYLKEQEERQKPFHNMIDELFTNPDFDKAAHSRERYDLGDTPEYMKKIGITGDHFSLSFKNIKSHQGKDADHALTKEEWHQLPSAIKTPFLITKLKDSDGKYRLFVNIMHNGHPVAVGVDVKRVNQGKDKPMLEVNSIKTVFGHKDKITENQEIVTYDEKMTPEQEALLRDLDYREYPSIQELSAGKVTENSGTDQIFEDNFDDEEEKNMYRDGEETDTNDETPRFQRVSPEPELTPEERQYWKKHEEAMKKWKAANGLKESDQPPVKPTMQNGERALDYAKRVMDYRRKEALWKTAPKLEDFRQQREDIEYYNRAHKAELTGSRHSSEDLFRDNKAWRIASDLQRLRHAVSRQKAYDKATVKAVTDFAQEFMSMGFGDNLSKGEMSRMLSSVKNATGAKNIKKEVDNILNVLMDNHLRNLENRLQKIASIRELKQTAQGVETQGKLELKGQRMIQAYREARQSHMTADELRERLGEIEEKMSRSGDQAEMWEQEYEGVSLALQYTENIEASRSELGRLQNEYKDAVKDYSNSGRTYQEQQEYLESLEEAMQENKMERIGMYGELLGRLQGDIIESVEGAKEFVEKEKSRVKNIHRMANMDLGGMDFGAFRKERLGQRIMNSSVARFFLQPLATFEQMLRQFGSRSATGEGYLYHHFMGKWRQASGNAWKGEKAAKEELDAKAREVFGKKVERWSDLYSIVRKLPTVDVEIIDQGEKKTLTLTQGNLLYIVMADKMADGRMKLRKMGITEEKVQQLKEQIDPKLLELGEWLQEEYLVNKREAYNKVHERMFGAPMAAIDHYFPIKVLSDARYKPEEVGTSPKDDSTLPKTITGSIIKRRRNSLPLDILGTDALSLAVEHVEQMERWAAFAEFNKDVNTLLSYTTFRNRVKNMTTVYGGGEQLWNTFRDVANIAGGAFEPSARKGSIDKAISNIAKGVTAAKISFRPYTAFKQILSAPAFLHDANIKDFVMDSVTPWKAWNWAMENMPLFEKRFKSRQAGDTRLMENPTDWKIWQNDIVQKLNRWGMSPNAFIDAVTCAVGAHAIYKTRLKRLKKLGMSDAVAHKEALKAAELAYNLTQQSSEGAMTSAIQMDRTAAANALSIFRNSSFSYTRQAVDALRNLKHRLQKGYKEDAVKFMAGVMMEKDDTLSREQAEKAAEAEYKRALWHDMARAANMMFVVTVLWNLGPYLPYLIMGGDDDEKEKMLQDALLKGLLAGPVEGFAGGSIISDMTGLLISGQGLGNYDVNPMPLISDVQNMINHFSYDTWAGIQDVFNILVQSGIGVNPQTLTDAVTAIIDASRGDMSTAREIALLTMRVLNVPSASADNYYIDELGMKASDAKRLSQKELAERYADYKFRKNVPLTGWFYSDEAEAKRKASLIKQFDKKVKERVAISDYNELRDRLATADDEKEKKMIADAMTVQANELTDGELLERQKEATDSVEQRVLSNVIKERTKAFVSGSVLKDRTLGSGNDVLRDSINNASSLDRKNAFISEYAKSQGTQDYYGRSNSNKEYQRLRTYEDVREDIELGDLKKKVKDSNNKEAMKAINRLTNKISNQKNGFTGDEEADEEMMNDIRDWRREAIGIARGVLNDTDNTQE